MGRITHEKQNKQAREVAEDPSRDACELVIVLLRDGKSERSEAAVDVACGGTLRGDRQRLVEAREGWGESRTRDSNCRLVRPSKDPAGMLVSWLPNCTGMRKMRGARRPSTWRVAVRSAMTSGAKWKREQDGAHHARDTDTAGS